MADKRIYELDGLRGLAAISLLLYHYTSRFSEKFETNIITDIFNFKYGNYGVEVFFAISGFVIFMSIEKIRNPFEFIYKRFIRLYPTFWICMLVTFFFLLFFGPQILKVNLKQLIINFSMLPSLFNVQPVDGVYWTLKVEMAFYVLILFLLVVKQIQKVLLIGFIYILLGIIVFAILRLPMYYYYGTLFLTGINFYQIWKNGGKWGNHLQIFLCLMLSFFMENRELMFVTLGVTSIFYLLVNEKLKFLSLAPFIFLGKISYALYLLHQYIGYTIQLHMIQAGITNFLILLVVPIIISVTLATLITFSVEKPLLVKLNNFYKLKFNKENNV